MVPFPGLGEKRQVSTNGGSFPAWLDDRQVAFVQPPENKLVAVDVETRGASLSVGASHPLLGGKPLPRNSVPGSLTAPLSVAPDGKRLLIIVPVDEESSPLVRVVSDWVSEIKKK